MNKRARPKRRASNNYQKILRFGSAGGALPRLLNFNI